MKGQPHDRSAVSQRAFALIREISVNPVFDSQLNFFAHAPPAR
jgi:hypothetical protein